MAKYFVFETQVRPDGEINVQPIVSRNSLAMGLSYYHERCSKMYANDQFVSVHVLITDEKLNKIEHCDVNTSYVEPEAAPEPEAEEANE